MDEKGLQNGANGTDGVNGKNDLPIKIQADVVPMPSGEITADPDAHLTEAEKAAAVRRLLLVALSILLT